MLKSWTTGLERLSLQLKLAIGFSLWLLIATAISFEGLLSQRELIANLQAFHGEDMRGIAIGKDAQIAHATIRRTIRQAVIAPDATERDSALDQLAKARLQLAKIIEDLRSALLREECRNDLSQFEKDNATFLRGLENTIALLRNGKDVEAKNYVASKEFQQPGITASEALDRVNRGQEEGAQESYLTALKAAHDSKSRSVLLIVLGLMFGGALWIVVSRSITRPLHRLRTALEQLASGKLDHEVPVRDYSNEIGELARAVCVLQAEAQHMEAQRWVKTNIAALSSEMQVASSLTELARRFLSGTALLLKFGQAAFYLFEEDERRLRLLDSYAHRQGQNLETYFALGQGLVGQCAVERKPIRLTDPPADYHRIGSGLGEATPRAIAVLPVMRNDRLMAVLELATFDPFSARQEALLDGLLPILAMSVEIMERSEKTAQLLEDTQRQAEKMEKQAAQLEEQAVEMEARQLETKAAEERSRLILGAVADGIWGLDTKGVLTFANPAAPAILGYSMEEFVGQGMHALVHHHYPDGSIFPAEACPMYHTFQDGQSRTVDNEVLWCKDGTPIPVEYSTTPIFKGDTLVGSVIVYRDISERKEAGEKIKRANFLADIALELTNSGYWHVDYSDPDYYYQSERAAKILGEPLKPDGRYHLHDEWFARLLEANQETANLTSERYQGAIDGRYDHYDATYAYKRPVDGKIVWIHANGKLVRDEQTGKIRYMYGAYQDITLHRQAEDRLRAATQLAQEAIKSDRLKDIDNPR